jgi:5,10-methylene-tetrahydrofolate dehydrogenase/methenyl tetrahydrofolate cyclohydrolase
MQSGNIIDGKGIADQIRAEIKAETEKLKIQAGGKVPGLAVVLVGDRKDSVTYVRQKQRAAEEAGFRFHLEHLPESTKEEEVANTVRKINADDAIHGIIVQLPLPAHINEKKILDLISIAKDADGFHPENMGALAMKGRDPLCVPCTPRGCVELLDRLKLPIDGRNAVIVGRSNTVGIPAGLLLLHRNATVTYCHSRTADLPEQVKRADILIVAIGKPEFVKGSWIKPGAVVIDVGINAVDDSTKKAGYRLVGDVEFAEAKKVASWITPVPGGVGPMTVAMLLHATLRAYKRHHKF